MDNRRVQIKVDNEWKDINFSELKRGNVFRLLDNGKEIIDKYGNTEFLATNKLKTNKEGKYAMEFTSKRECENCKFYEYESFCCMHDCRVVAIFDTEESAAECKWFKLGLYDEVEMEKNNYK